MFRDFPTFSRICIFFLLIFSLLTLLTSAFQPSILSEVSESKLPSTKSTTSTTSATSATSPTSATSATSATSSSAKDFNCSQLKSLLKCVFFFPGDILFTTKFEEGITIVEGGPYTNQDATLSSIISSNMFGVNTFHEDWHLVLNN